MGKIVKGVFYLLGVLIGLTLILLIAIPLLVDPNDYREEIGNIVAEQTGRTLAIKGPIELSLFPWVGIELGEMSLSNARGFEERAFAQVDRVDIKIKLLPLLRKTIEMETIILHGLSLNLAKSREGGDNWSDLGQPSGPPAARQTQQPPAQQSPAVQPPGAPEVPAATALITAFAIHGLQIKDAHIRWDDQSQQQQIEINHLNLHSGAISLESEFPLEISFNATIHPDAETPPIDGDIALKTLIALNVDKGQYQLKQLRLKSTLRSTQLPGGQLSSEIGGDLSADLRQQHAQADGLSIELLGMKLVINSRVSQLDNAPRASGEISLKVTQGEPLHTLLGDALPATINNQLLESVAFSTLFDVNIGPEAVALDKLLLKFDQTTLKGSASLAGFGTPAIRYDLDIDTINIDRYLPPAESTPTQVAGSTPNPAAGPASDEPLPIPVALLGVLDIDGSLRLGALQVMNLHSQKVVTTVKTKGGEINLAPLSAELYQGKFDGAIHLDLRDKVPVIQIEEQLRGVAAGPLLKDLLGKDYVTGRALVTASITTRGDRISQFKKGLNGKAELRFEDGAVQGINIASLIRDAYAAYKKQPLEKSAQKPQTDFALLSATVSIKDGVVTNNDLNAQSPLLRISGAGQANLVTERIDYRAQAAVVKSLEGQGGKPLSELDGLTIPLFIKGSFSDPKVSVDMDKLLDEKIKAKVDAAKARAQQKIDLKKTEVDAAKARAQQESQEKLDLKKEALKKRLQDKLKLKF